MHARLRDKVFTPQYALKFLFQSKTEINSLKYHILP